MYDRERSALADPAPRDSTQSDTILRNQNELNANLIDILKRLQDTRNRLLGEAPGNKGDTEHLTPVASGVLDEIAQAQTLTGTLVSRLDSLSAELHHRL